MPMRNPHGMQPVPPTGGAKIAGDFLKMVAQLESKLAMPVVNPLALDQNFDDEPVYLDAKSFASAHLVGFGQISGISYSALRATEQITGGTSPCLLYRHALGL